MTITVALLGAFRIAGPEGVIELAGPRQRSGSRWALEQAKNAMALVTADTGDPPAPMLKPLTCRSPRP